MLLNADEFDDFARVVRRIVRATSSGYYRRRNVPLVGDDLECDRSAEEEESPEARAYARPYFETLFVDNMTAAQEKSLRTNLRSMRQPEDPFIYEPVVAPSLEDALIAVMINHNIQVVIVRFGFDLRSRSRLKILTQYLSRIGDEDLQDLEPQDYGAELCRLMYKVRPELDLYLVTDRGVEDIAGRDLGNCRRIFYNSEDFTELHLNMLRGVSARYETPFFSALKEYSKKPTGVFHALPISRGKSIARSHWIQDMGDVLRPEYFPRRDLGHLGWSRFPARALRPDQARAGTGGAGVRREAHLLRHQRHIDLQQDRGAGADPARRHRAGRPRLPQVAPLRPRAGRRATSSTSTATRCMPGPCTARCRCTTSRSSCWT